MPKVKDKDYIIMVNTQSFVIVNCNHYNFKDLDKVHSCDQNSGVLGLSQTNVRICEKRCLGPC